MNKTRPKLKPLSQLDKFKSLNRQSSINNVAMKYRYEKMKLSEMSSKLYPNLNNDYKNLFHRLTSHRGVHMDKDISLSQQILHSLKDKRVNKKMTSFTFADMYDIPTVVDNSGEIAKKAQEIVQKHQMKIQSKHEDDILPPQNSLSKMLSLVEADDCNYNEDLLLKNSSSNRNSIKKHNNDTAKKQYYKSRSIENKVCMIKLKKSNNGQLLRRKFCKNQFNDDLFEQIDNPSCLNYNCFKMKNNLSDKKKGSGNDSVESINASMKKKNDHFSKSLSSTKRLINSTQFVEIKPWCYLPNPDITSSTSNKYNINKLLLSTQTPMNHNTSNNTTKIPIDGYKIANTPRGNRIINNPLHTYNKSLPEARLHQSSSYNNKAALDQLKKMNSQTMEYYAKANTIKRNKIIQQRRKSLKKIQDNIINFLDKKEDAFLSKIITKPLSFKLPS